MQISERLRPQDFVLENNGPEIMLIADSQNPAFQPSIILCRLFPDNVRAFATPSSGDDPLTRESISKGSEEALKDYLPDKHCPIERLLAEQIVPTQTNDLARKTKAKNVEKLLARSTRSAGSLNNKTIPVLGTSTGPRP